MSAETDICSILEHVNGGIGAVIGGAVAALSGAWWSSRTSRKLDRERRTLELLSSFQRDVFPMQGDADEALKQDCPSETKLDRARSVGNWFEIFALLIEQGVVEESLVHKSKLENQMIDYLNTALASPSSTKGRINPRKNWPNLCTRYGGKKACACT